MKRILFAIAMVLTFCSAFAQDSQQLPPLPNDPAFRIGKLDNGLTYYIRHNNYPKDKADFYILDRVGSLQETDEQQGLAHFLEHMAFNGSEHFKAGEIIDFTRSLGLTFGKDLNAMTGIGMTMYTVCNVPTTRQTALDSCLLVLKDWANGLTLADKEIDKERGVIHQEWQLRNNVEFRFWEQCMSTLLGGCRWGTRLPIGKMSIVDNFKPQALRDYYHSWYRPDNQAIVVIGNIDVDRTEKAIRDLFSSIAMPKNAEPFVPVMVPKNAAPICVYFADKEQASSEGCVSMKYEDLDEPLRQTVALPITQFTTEVVCTMLTSRLRELSDKPDCPFTTAKVEDSYFQGALTQKSLDVNFTPKAGQEMAALKAISEELQRARQHGFTASEYQRAKDSYMSELESRYKDRENTPNEEYFNQVMSNYIAHEAIPSVESEYQLMQMLAPQLPVEAVNEGVKELISAGDSNVVAYFMVKDGEGVVKHTPEEMAKVITDASKATLAAYVDNVKQEPLMTTLPKKGTVKATKENTQLGYKEYTLSNGARVVVKKTDFKNDEVKFIALADGGVASYGATDLYNLIGYKVAAKSFSYGGYGPTELSKMLAGKNVTLAPSMGNTHFCFDGTTTPKDLETFMQWLYLGFTAVGKDENSYAKNITTMKATLANLVTQPEVVFQDSLAACLYSHNKLLQVPDTADLNRASLDRMLQMTKDATANAANWVFYFSGNVDEATLLPLMEQYIASLPSKGKKVAVKMNDPRTLFTGTKQNHFSREMATAKAMVTELWRTNDLPYSPENRAYTQIAAKVLTAKMLKTIREDAGIAYAAETDPLTDMYRGKAVFSLVTIAPVQPDKTAEAARLTLETYKDQLTAPDASYIEKAKKEMLNQLSIDQRTNDYWLDVMSAFVDYGLNTDAGYADAINAATPAKIADFLKANFVSAGNHYEIIMTAK